MQPGSLGAVGYDDEGVKTSAGTWSRNGILVNYQAIRDQVHILGQQESHGCCYSDSWSDVQFQRMPNVSLRPAPGRLTPDADDRRTWTRASTSSATARTRSTSSATTSSSAGQLFYEIKNGKIVGHAAGRRLPVQHPGVLELAASAICDKRDYRLGGSFFDGKGQPGQVSAVSHGSATTRFNGVNVINTARKI